MVVSLSTSLFVLAAGTSVAAEPSDDEESAMLRLLETGDGAERARAARWLGLHLVREARDPLCGLGYLPPAEADDDLRRVGRQMCQLLREPTLLKYRTEDEVRAHLDDPEPLGRLEALRHLKYHDLPDALPRLVAALNDQHPWVRGEAIMVLGHLAGGRHRDEVARRLDDPDPGVRRRAIGYFRGGERSDPSFLERLVPLVADSSEEVRSAAVDVVDSWDLPERAAELLLHGARTTASGDAAARYLEALRAVAPASRRPPAWRDVVASLLRRAEEVVRLQAARLLVEDGDAAASATLQELLASEEGTIRMEAARALAEAGVRPGRGRLERLLRDPDPEVARAGVDLASASSAADLTELLRPLLLEGKAHDDVLARAIFALSRAGDREDVDLLARFGRATGSTLLRAGAVEGVATLEERLGTGAGLVWYRELLSDDRAEGVVLAAVASALRRTGDPSFLPLVVARLRACPDDDPHLGEELSSTIGVLLGRRLHGPGFAR